MPRPTACETPAEQRLARGVGALRSVGCRRADGRLIAGRRHAGRVRCVGQVAPCHPRLRFPSGGPDSAGLHCAVRHHKACIVGRDVAPQVARATAPQLSLLLGLRRRGRARRRAHSELSEGISNMCPIASMPRGAGRARKRAHSELILSAKRIGAHEHVPSRVVAAPSRKLQHAGVEVRMTDRER